MALIQNNTTEKTGFSELQILPAARTESNGEFDRVMQNTKQEPACEKQLSAKTVTEKQDSRQSLTEKLAAVSSKAQEKLAASEAEVVSKEVLEAAGTLTAGIKEILMDMFQVSEEDLTALMQDMGMTDVDLLNPQAINQLAVALTGAEDAMELLFQPEFTNTMKELNEQISSLKQEAFAAFPLSEKEINEILAEADAGESDSIRTADDGQALQPEMTSEEQPEIILQQPEKHQSADAKPGEQSFQNMNQTLAGNPILSGIEQAVEAVLPEADVQNVVRQVVEQIRVQVTEDMSSFEMQLNPEHLGKINLQVAAKNGVVTAQIAAENAAVKEALESQLVVLKESLNNQGIKVEAVEVTIASHEFERNLDGEKDHGEQQESSKKRRFRFDVMEAAEEELTPAEAVVRDMMLANGNQINYMA